MKWSKFKSIDFRFFLAPIFIIGLCLLIIRFNFVSDTWLTGWDTLHPEFNFKLNFLRLIWGVWRDDQGLGALAAHSHMAELPRLIVIWFLSFVFPLQNLRLVYVLICFILGPLGVYWYFSRNINKEFSFGGELSAILASLFYIFNLGTVQHFFVPFEMFPVAYASMGWLFGLAHRYIKESKNKHLLIFGLVSFLSAPMAYASLLWYATAAGLGLYCLMAVIQYKTFKVFRSAVLIGLTLIATNGFWLFPNLYFIAKGTDVVQNAKINRVFSQEAFLQNKSYGTLSDAMIFKNFLFNWNVYDHQTGEFKFLLENWINHVDSSLFNIIGYSFFTLGILGIIWAIYCRKYEKMWIVPVGVLGLIMLINMNPPLESLFSYLRENFGAFREGLRNPFTKFSIIYMFSLAVLFGIFWEQLFDYVKNKFTKLYKPIIFLSFFLVFILFGYYSAPMFNHGLISSKVQIDIPEAYFDLFNFMEDKPKSAKIAVMPVNSMWGWEYNNWGYQGAGFVWFGLEQPVLVRDFDRWSPYNEGFYKEVNFALYNQNLGQLEKVLSKYKIQYLIVDKSRINPGGDQNVLYFNELQDLIKQTGNIEKIATFDFIDVYSVLLSKIDSNIWSSEIYQNITATNPYSGDDTIYKSYGDYFSYNQNNQITFPFAGIDGQIKPTFSYLNNNLNLEYSNLNNVQNQIIYPDYIDLEENFPVSIYLQRVDATWRLKLEVLKPELIVDDKTFEGGSIWQEFSLGEFDINPGFITIDDKTFDLSNHNISNDFTFIGQLLLSAKKNIEINVYGGEKISYQDYQNKLSKNTPRLCADPNIQRPITIQEGVFELEIGEESVCLGAIENILEESVLDITYSSYSEDGVYPWFCVVGSSNTGCLNDSVPTQFVQDKALASYRYLVPVSADNYWLSIVIQGQDSEEDLKIKYSDFKLTSTKLLEKFEVNLYNDFKFASSESVIDLPSSPEKITLKLPQIPVIQENFSLTRGVADQLNCDLYKRGRVEKKYGFNSIFYSADNNGVSCDYFDYIKVPSNQSYVLQLSGENVKGRSIKTYIYNRTTKKMDTEELLSPDNFNDSIVLLPRVNSDGYTVNLETRSFGKENSENKLTQLNFWPLPYNFLNKLELKSDHNKEISSSINLIETEKIGLSIYKVNFSGQGIIVLNESFNEGWKAIYIQNNPKIWNYVKAYWQNSNLEHVKVNGWSNGWVIPNENSPEDKHLLILFVPQYLQWLGFGILGLFIIMMSFFSLIRFKRVKN